MIHIIYNKDYPIALNDGAIIAVAQQIVAEHGSTEEVYTVTTGQDLFISAIRSAMCQEKVSHLNLSLDVVVGDDIIQRRTLTDCYRINDYTGIPDVISEILFPLV